MPKFSAYMRGEKGPQGGVGQAVLLDGIVSSSSELPPNTENQKNLIYYVGNNEDGYNLYVYTTTEQSWQDLGSVNGIEGQSGGFSTNQNAQIHMLNPDANPTISITTDENSPDTAKVFNFNFGIPRSYNAGFSTNQNIEVENVNEVEDMYASISTDEQSPDTSKVFNFKFGIPRGESAGFGEIESTAELIPSASTYTQSGNIVSFSTNYENPIKESIVNIEPVQDLHGYDNPWPAGGGINKLSPADASYDNNGIKITNNGNGTYTVKGTATATVSYSVALSESYIFPNSNVYLHARNSATSSNFVILLLDNSNNQLVTCSLSSLNGVSSATNKNGQTATKLQFYISSGAVIDMTVSPMILDTNTATSYASYSNICPISGWTGCNVQRTGKNLLNPVSPYLENTLITTEGVINSNNNFDVWRFPTKSGDKFSLSVSFSAQELVCRCFLFNKNMEFVSLLANKTNSNSVSETYTIASDGWLIVNLKKTKSNPQVELSSSPTPYEPYLGTTYPISWETETGTVYGGSLDVTTGVLTVTHIYKKYNGSENWTFYEPSNSVLCLGQLIGRKNLGTSANVYGYCNMKQVLQDGKISGIVATTISSDNLQVYRIDTNFGISEPNINKWKAYLADNNLEILYELEQPQTYQLTPTQITTLLGQNNIWADTGDIQVSYDKFNQPHVEVIADESSPNSAKNFTFHFDIPQGPKGDKGDAFSIYEPLSFTTGSNYWVNTTTFVYPRGANDKLPIYIYNEDTDKLDNDFIFTESTITYNSEQPFNGTLYLMTSANRPSITIGEVSTTSFDGQMSVSLNENSTSSDAIFDFTLASGPDGEAGGFGEITSSAELIPSTSNYIEKNSIVSFTTDDEIKEVVVDIDPVQDLHEYDSPWIGGSGKNLINEDNAEIGTAWNGASNSARARLIISCKPNTTYTISINGTLSVSNIYRIFSSTLPASSAGIEITNSSSNTFTTDSDSAYIIIAFSKTDITKADIIAMKLQLEEGSTATDYETYSNICPITGWTGMNITRSGKNLFNNTATIITQDGLTYTVNNDKSVTVSGTRTNTTRNDSNINLGTLNVKKGQQLTISGSVAGYDPSTGAQIFCNSSKAFPVGNRLQTFNGNEITRTALADDTITVKIYIYTTEAINITFYPMIRFASVTNSTYEPYQGDDYPISWSTQAGVVYGGNLNVTTGILTVSKVKVNFENLTFNQQWATDGNINTAYANLPYVGKNINNDSRSGVNAITNFSKWYPYDRDIDNVLSLYHIRNNNDYPTAFTVNYIARDTYSRIVIKDSQCSTIEEYRQKYINNNYYVVYDLAEPIIHHLTPTQITTLLNENIIWADTGETQVTYSKLNQPYVEVTTDEESPNSAKNFNFHFSIPRGKEGDKGERGDSIAIYEGISFSTGSSYWNNNTLTIPRGDNNKLPIYIYNEDANKLDDNFTFTSTNIIYSTTSAFNGTLYLMSETLRNTLAIGNVSTTTYGNGSHFSLNPESTSTDAIFDVVLEQGPRGETALSAQVGRVSSTTAAPNVEIEGEQDLIFNFDLPKGDKGDKGDPFTVEVNNTIDILNYYETPAIETTSTSTGISLKFKLPPSVSARLGDLSQYNTLSLASGLVVDILPVNKGGTSATTFTANAVLLGNGSSSFKTKNTANGAFYATSANAEPSFGVLPIAQGGTSATTAAKAWTALGGGASGKHPDSYFALANHGTHVSYGTTVTAIGTASAGTASTVSRSDHVHNISVTTGDNNGQVKIAGTNVSVKGLGSFAYKSALSSEDLPSLDFVPLAGGTISGNITYKINTVNASLTNNNVSSTLYPSTFQVLDMSSRILAGLEGVINSNGNIDSYWYVVNYDTSGNQVAQKGIKLSINKSGGFSCTIEGNTIISGNTTFNAYFTIPSSMYGTTDLTPGTSNLPTGQLYFVYE